MGVDKYLRPKYEHWSADPKWRNVTSDASLLKLYKNETEEVQEEESSSWEDLSEDDPNDKELDAFVKELD